MSDADRCHRPSLRLPPDAAARQPLIDAARKRLIAARQRLNQTDEALTAAQHDRDRAEGEHRAARETFLAVNTTEPVDQHPDRVQRLAADIKATVHDSTTLLEALQAWSPTIRHLNTDERRYITAELDALGETLAAQLKDAARIAYPATV